MSKKSTVEEFIQKARLVHGDKFDYSKVEYKGNKIPVCIICPIHGEVWQTPDSHLHSKTGCIYCAKKHKYTTEEFIEKAKEIHGDKFDYSKVEYINKYTKVCIICNTCGHEFWQTPDNHINGKQGCPKCANKCIDTEEFIRRAKLVHGDKYDYSNSVYTGTENNVVIHCNKCGEDFNQTPHHHLDGEGCPNCKTISKGENKIVMFLKKENIEFERQKTYDDCRDIKPLPFDFYLPDYNLLIEYQGDQHTKKRGYMLIGDKFEKVQKHDAIKKEYCSKPENPDLFEISYKKYHYINEVLTEKLKLNKIEEND